MTRGITIIGLGPGSPVYLTREADDLLRQADEVYLHTRHHPAAAALPDHLTVHSFDSVYEEQETFDDVYRQIADRVLSLGQRPSGVIYAVPGHPLVGEATVQLILTRARESGIPVRVVAGLSFIEAVATCLSLDLLTCQIVDAMELAARYHPHLDPALPALVGQLYDRHLAAEVKLTLLNLYPPEHQVTLSRGAGTSVEQIRHFSLYELDHQRDLDDLTTLYIPPLPPECSLSTFQDIVAHLRAPDGCPWDRAQTHQTLRPYLLEETYEVLTALDADDPQALCEELGDLLLQVLLHAQLAVEAGEFSMADVCQHIVNKLVHRHPHVFGDIEVTGPEEVLHNWQQIKRAERDETEGLLDGIPVALPALARSQAIQDRVARVGFDWPEVGGIRDKVLEELGELEQAEGDQKTAEFGDLLFVLVNLARRMDIDAESALRQTNQRFSARYAAMEARVREKGQYLGDLTLEEMDEIWQVVKGLG